MHRVLIGVVVTGAMIIAGIGFAGSYAAVRELAIKKGFGNFSYVFPVGIDAGICVLLALDLLLTWIRIPFPLLRQTAWLLTAATIAFNGAAAWPDPLGVGMHAVIPILFVVAVEAARHAIGRIADITADKHMEGVRLTRWLLSPVPTFLLWRRMKLWELRSYDQVIKLEQERLVYQARLRSRFGRAWRRKAPVESLMPLRLAKYGVPLADTAPDGLAAAGIELPALPAQTYLAADGRAAGAARVGAAAPPGEQRPELAPGPQQGQQEIPVRQPEPAPDPNVNPWLHARDPQQIEYHGDYDPSYEPQYSEEQYAAWQYEQEQYEQELLRQQQGVPDQFAQQRQQLPQEQQPLPVESPSETTGSFPIPSGPGRTRELGEGGGPPEPTEEDFYLVFKKSIDGSYPTSGQLRDDVEATYGITLAQRDADRMVNRFTNRHTAELQEDHIA
ncbi:DUF2637 domain-containing protein [Streptomyces shenzhenensis]|uniref:DUF2637 domain-containing protein n=1 Tax=Streptomyces shenzhenensis TaxID=943815 RepID=UPI0015F0BC79|nr:DUF2637 domain-containing protein [Streptomyces shenzhenensis]